MNIVLTGFMGTGKSTVGRRVADLLKIPFFDVDETIKRQTGRTIADLFRDRGESGFRVLESATIQELSMQLKAVIATGGGALMNPQNREFLEKNGVLVCLSARTGTLLERLKDDLTRPLLAGENTEQRMERLMQERQAVYAMCPIQIQTDEKTIDQVAREVVEKVTPRWQAAS
jgi:shikimate kinase